MKYNESLDGYRTLAVMAVMLLHTAHRLDIPSSSGLGLYIAMRSGWIGVDAFFVLSGFLITNILLQYRDQDARTYFRTFYVRRMLRIFPLYYLFVPAILIFLTIFSSNKPNWVEWISRLTYMQNIVVVLYPLQHGSLLGHTWSLAIEEQYYFFWPLLVYFVRPSITRRLLIVGIFCSLLFRVVMVAGGHMGPVVQLFSLARADSLFAGSLLAMSSLSDKHRKLWLVAGAISAAIFLLVGALNNNYYDETVFNLTIGFTLVAIMFSAVIINAVNPSSLTAKFLKTKPLPQIGRMTYGIYLFHLPIFTVVAQMLNPLTETLQYSARFFILFFVSTSITLAVAAISFRFFEAPILKIKNKFNYSRKQNTFSEFKIITN